MNLTVIVAQINAQSAILFLVVLVVGVVVAFLIGRRIGTRQHVSVVAELQRESSPTASTTVIPVSSETDQTATGANVFGQADYQVFREHLRGALDQIGQGVIIWAEDGQEIYRNAQARRFLEARDSLVLVEIAVQDLRARDLYQPQTNGPVQEEVELIGPPVQVYVITLYPFSSNGGGQGALVLVEDASAQRRIDTVRRDFVANISHELKTPIGALGLLSETILDEEDETVVRRLVQRMVQEADRASRTVDDLLELSQIEFGDETEFDEVLVEEIVKDAVSRFGGAIEQSQVNIETNIEDGLQVIGNHRQLVSAMYNLIDNALKYSRAHSTVTVTAQQQNPGFQSTVSRAEIAVADTGIGIPRRDQDRVFERFYRVDRARTRSSGGTGLGLAIVRHIVSNHGGTIEVSSIEGVGSTFTITLECPRVPTSDGTTDLVNDERKHPPMHSNELLGHDLESDKDSHL